ncbi:hypothetical protein TRAPUB_5083 [Trametes pubescens]|uniref:Uncharacterized protein n=1 Tax=Trametes pubescens TaxID=154538 RepID=A0A1M2V9H0_TRAPU|nr:hypothetical protein TRAPUB_5083 [Trametes pubescens]
MEGENRRRGQMKAEGKGSEAGLATPRGFFGVCASSRRFGRRTGMHGCVLCSSIVHIHRGPGSIHDNVQLLPASYAEIAPQHALHLECLLNPGPNLAIIDVDRTKDAEYLSSSQPSDHMGLAEGSGPTSGLFDFSGPLNCLMLSSAEIASTQLLKPPSLDVSSPAERAPDKTARRLQAMHVPSSPRRRTNAW